MVRGITRSLVLAGAVAAAGSAYASNLDYATNNSPEFFRNPAGRTSASDSADIAANNPAGTVRMGFGIFYLVTVLGSIAWCTVHAWYGHRIGDRHPELL